MDAQEKAEIHEEIRAEVLEQEKADKEKTKWLNYVSITTILIAICTTLSTYIGGNHNSQCTQSQIQASDQWAFFQGKSIKGYLYEVQLDNLNTQLLTTQPGPAYDSIAKHISEYKKNVAKYKAEKEKISLEAKHLESVRDDSQKHANAFGLAVVFLEVSILLSSIAALLKIKPIWYLSMIPGIVGIVHFINGFLLFF